MLSAATQTALQALSSASFTVLWEELGEAEKPAVLRARCRTDRALFCRVFFAEHFEKDWSPVHLEFLTTPKVSWRERSATVKRCRVAPRGSAKSTLKSFAELAHDICYGLEVCILVFSTGFQLSEDLVKDLYRVFSHPEAAPELHQVYGPFRVSGSQTQFSVQVPGGERLGTQVAAKSFGSGATRGHRYQGRRPSKVVLDDTVNAKHVRNPDQRQESWKYLNSDILKAGTRGTLYELVGTIQHPDDLVARVAASPGWDTKTWKNLIRWPTNMALWEQVRQRWADRSNPHRLEDARQWMEAHRQELAAGAEVLWAEGRSLWELMQAFWEAPASFWAEDQNQPRDVDACLFDLERVRTCRYDPGTQTITTSRGTVIPLSACTVALWLDPSSGADQRDYPALAVVAHHRLPQAKLGMSYVLHAELIRRQPSAQQEALWQLWERFAACRPKVGMDATGTQALLGEAFTRQQEERRKAGKAWQMPIHAYTLSENKQDRIGGLEPALANGWLELADDLPGEVLDQLRDFPNGAFDDGIDAIERAEWLLTRAVPHVESYKRG